MGLTIALETERGEKIEEIEDPANLLHQLLPSHNDETYQCLRFIDWYGDTVFNHMQMKTFLLEWDRLAQSPHTTEERTFMVRVEGLARRCLNEPHLYLKFYGD